MPIFITQGRYTRAAIKGMIVKPEDRAEALSRHMAKAGGRVLSYYMTFGEYDFLTVLEAPGETQMAAALLAAASSGGVSDLRTTLAMTSIEANGASQPRAIWSVPYKSLGDVCSGARAGGDYGRRGSAAVAPACYKRPEYSTALERWSE